MPLTFQPPGDVPPRKSIHLRDKTLADVAAHVSREYVAAASFETGFTYFPDASGKITRVDLKFSLSIEMPVWDNYASRPKKEKQEWDRFYRALLEHEKGHILIYKREAQAMYAAMMRATPDTIQSVHDAEGDRIRKLGEQYDKDTDHGRKQRTSFGSTVINLGP
jgi:predicted secreted Zn-dependent protease